MNPKTILTEAGWNEVAPKNCNRKDSQMRAEFVSYSRQKDDDFDLRCKALGKIAALAGTLKAVNEVKGDKDAVKHLTDVISASKVKQSELIKAKAEAEKAKALAAKTVALTQKKADEAEKKREQEDEKAEEPEEEEDEDEQADTLQKLTTALKTIKTSKVPYYFIACDAKPYGLMVSRKDIRKSATHKKELAKLAGGNTRAPKFGTCSSVAGKLIFEMEKPPSGLARILQKWIKTSTGLGLKVMVGTESAEDEEEPLLTGVNPELQRPKGPAQEPPPEGADVQPAAAEEPRTGMTRSFEISASVGRRGKNKPEDVEAVQLALNRRVKAGLNVDGKCDPKTLKAIEDFQKALGKFKPDGLVEPGRGTARALASNAKLGPTPEPPKPIAPPKLGKPTLEKAPVVWHGTREILDTNIKELKKAIRQEYSDEHPDLLAEIDKRMTRLDVVLEKLDHRLADSLANAYAAKDPAARKTEMAKAKTILTDYIKYVKSEPMIAHMDSNPFGVKTSLQKVLTDSLTHVAKVIR